MYHFFCLLAVNFVMLMIIVNSLDPPRSGPPKSGSKLFDTDSFLEIFFGQVNFEKSHQTTTKAGETTQERSKS